MLELFVRDDGVVIVVFAFWEAAADAAAANAICNIKSFELAMFDMLGFR